MLVDIILFSIFYLLYRFSSSPPSRADQIVPQAWTLYRLQQTRTLSGVLTTVTLYSYSLNL